MRSKNGFSVFLHTAHSSRLTGGGGGGGDMVSVAQRLEHWTVAPGVEGSNPFTHPIPFGMANLKFQNPKNLRYEICNSERSEDMGR